MTELKRNKQTGIVEVWENGKKIGEVITMGDKISKSDYKDDKPEQERW